MYPLNKIGINARLFLGSKANTNEVDYQNSEEFGRGEMHLSAMISEGDFIVYQAGSWSVDGVEVGDGSPPEYVSLNFCHLYV